MSLKHSRERMLGALIGLVATAASATAQAPTPPVPKQADTPQVWLYYLVIAVLLAATVIVSVIPSKRGHLD